MNRIFVACIKRWPITSLHPFGTLVEQLGEMGDLRVETDALLRDNNFGPDDFSDAVLKNIGFDEWSVNEETLATRRDFRTGTTTFTIDPNGTQDLDNALHVKDLGDGKVEVGIHVADAAHFIKANSLVDREAKKRGTGVYLMNRAVNMLPPKLSSEICSLSPGEARFTVSIVFEVDLHTGKVTEDKTWIGKGIINSSGKLTYDDVDAVIHGNDKLELQGATVRDIEILKVSKSPICEDILFIMLSRLLHRNFVPCDMKRRRKTSHLFGYYISLMMKMFRWNRIFLILRRLTRLSRSLATRQTLLLRKRLQQPFQRRRSYGGMPPQNLEDSKLSPRG